MNRSAENLEWCRDLRLLCVGNSELSAIRGYFNETAADLGVRNVLLVDPTEDPNIGNGGEVHEIDLKNPGAVVDLVRQLHADRPFAGITTYMEPYIELYARLAQGLGLPAISPATALRCRSKRAMRDALAASGVPVPAYRWLVAGSAPSEVRKAAGAIGFPCILKPVACWSSCGVVKIESEEEIEDIFLRAADVVRAEIGAESEFLIEEFVTGREFSCEGVVDRDGIHVAGVTQKWITPPPYFEEHQHVFPADLSEEERRQIVDTTERAVAALGIDIGGFHAELKISPTRGVRVIEVGSRLGGDGIPVLVRLASGQDLAASAIAASLGGAIGLDATRERFAGIRFFFPPREGRLKRAELDLDLRRVPGIANFTFTAKPGQQILLPPNNYGARCGWVIAVDRHREGLIEKLERVEQAMVWEFE